MKILSLLCFSLMLMSCSFLEERKTHPSSLEETSSHKIVNTLRKVANLKKDDFSFVFQKMKIVIDNYKELKKKLNQLEKKLDSMVAKTNLKTESSSLNLLEEEKIAEDEPLFSESFVKNDSSSEQHAERTPASSQGEGDSLFSQARDLFTEQSWESAISQFQKYREKYPQGLYYLEATYYMGEAFRHLNMTPESHIFYKEILDSYPESDWALKAKARLNP